MKLLLTNTKNILNTKLVETLNTTNTLKTIEKTNIIKRKIFTFSKFHVSKKQKIKNEKNKLLVN